MQLHRIVPNLNVDDASTGHDFYEGLGRPGNAPGEAR